MKTSLYIRLACAIVCLVVLEPICVMGADAKLPRQFRIFDATFYSDKPVLSNWGIENIPIVYSGTLWDRNEDRNNLPREERVAMLAKQIESSSHSELAVIDIEHWPWVEHQGNVVQGMGKFLTVLEWFKKYAPSVAFGYYGVPPVPDYDSGHADESAARYQGWKKQNDRIIQLAAASQALFPSLYAFSPNKEQWVKSAIAHIREARRYETHAPVYVFLWPQYHEITRGRALEFLDRQFWRMQLETAMQHADGIVIWGGWDIKKNTRMKWDGNAPWWLETVSFLEGKQ